MFEIGGCQSQEIVVRGSRKLASRRGAALAGVAAIGLLAAGCGRSEDAGVENDDQVTTTADSSTTDPDLEERQALTTTSTDDSETVFPDVIDATASGDDEGTWTVSATLSSPYDSPARYADAWRVVGPDGMVYGTRELAHDHAGEQPFTRSQSGIEIPGDVDVVTIEGRDQISGWGGATFELTLER